MESTLSKSALAIALSRLETFNAPKVRAEQYTLDSELAATILWNAYMQGNIKNKALADLGAGTGIIGIGALLLGAKTVFFVDNDKEALDIAKSNLAEIQVNRTAIFRCEDVSLFNERVDTIIQNPPFGTKEKHADRQFLERAFAVADNIYTIHKLTSEAFIAAITKKHGFRIAELKAHAMPIKACYSFHKSRIKPIKVGVWHLIRDNSAVALKD